MESNESNAGIYIHVPFCKRACSYCNFYFSTSLQLKEPLVKALLTEISLRRDYLENKQIGSVYFGGGTPSLLSSKELSSILDHLQREFNIVRGAEITLEANPDDLTIEKLHDLKSLGINRLSIGVQSFFDRDLQWMNRMHSAEQSERSIQDALDAGFENLTIDLIYGIPGQSDEEWVSNIEKAVGFGIPHLSCYALTVEPKTELHFLVEKKHVQPVDEIQFARQFELLVNYLEGNGYEQYEISNFAKHKKYAVHNTSYWTGARYAGFGPSAHSYNGTSRQWNIANNAIYIKEIEAGNLPFEKEILTPDQQFNEYIMVSLRTMWGVDLHLLESRYGEVCFSELMKSVAPYIQSGHVFESAGKLIITKKGKFIADRIISDLFIV